MSSKRRTIQPKRQLPKHARRLYPSPALCRFFAAVGFTVSGLLTFYGLCYLLGLDNEFTRTKDEWNSKEVATLTVSFVVAVVCALWGFARAASIEVTTDESQYLLSVLWQFLACGSIIWTGLLMLVAKKMLGDEKMSTLIGDLGQWYVTAVLVGTGGGGSLLIGVFLIICKQMQLGSKPNRLVCVVLSSPIAIGLGYLQGVLLGINTHYWLLTGILFPLALMPAVVMLFERDERQRKAFLARK